MTLAATIGCAILVLGANMPANALGTNSASCGSPYPGTLYGGSYQNNFSDAGGWSQRSSCGSQVSVFLSYQVYPGGGSYANTGVSYGTTYISRAQPGTVNGYHSAWVSGQSLSIHSIMT